MTIKAARLLALILVMASAVGAAEEPAIDAYLVEQVESAGIPGLTVAVVRDGKTVFEGAYGESLTPRHVFHFASVSKPFVATAIVQLVEQGKLELDDPVVKHLPYFRLDDDRYGEITIRQMLNHTSGMPDVDDYEWDKPQFDDGAAERYVRSLGSEELLWAPGTDQKYSNMAFDVLGDVIGKVSGMSFEEFVRANILAPIGMPDSSFIYPEIDERLRVSGHIYLWASVSDVYPYNRRHAPSSTLNSSVSEMTRWMLVNLNQGELDGHRILRPESYDLLWTPSVTVSKTGEKTLLPTGLSWFLGEHDGHRAVAHGGGDRGFRSYILLLPDEEIGVVLASNWSRTKASEIARGVLDLVLADDPGSISQ